MRKEIKTLIIVACLVFALSLGVKADAAGTKSVLKEAPTAASEALSGSYTLSYISSDRTSIGIDFSDTSYYKEVVILDYKKQVVKSDRFISYASFSGLKKNRLYYYTFRSLGYDANYNLVPTSDYAKMKPFTTDTSTFVSTRGRKGRFRVPRIKGVAKYKIYLATSRNGKYRYVKTAKKGKSVNIYKYRGKKLAFWQNYYFKIVPILSNGKKAAGYYTVYRQAFYIRKVISFR